jgi:hypothetical protein
VDQEQIEHLDVERLERRVDAAQRLFEVQPVVGQLARYEKLRAVDARLVDRLAHFALVSVHLRGVDVAVADLDRVREGLDRGFRWNQEDAKSELRDLDAVVQRQRGDCGHRVSSLAISRLRTGSLY